MTTHHEDPTPNTEASARRCEQCDGPMPPTRTGKTCSQSCAAKLSGRNRSRRPESKTTNETAPSVVVERGAMRATVACLIADVLVAVPSSTITLELDDVRVVVRGSEAT